MAFYIVKLEDGVWLDKGEGDRRRASLEKHASKFESLIKARAALKKAREFSPFVNAKIVKYERWQK